MGTTPTISSGVFDQIAADERTSGLHIEVKGVANVTSGLSTACIVAQMLPTGTAQAGVATPIPGDGSAAVTLFGRGSHAYRLVMAFRAGNTTTPIDVIALSDNSAGVAASGSVLIAGTATAAGTLSFYVGLDRIQVGVAVGDTAAVLAAELASAINASSDLMVTAATTSTVGQVTITCRHKGEIGNDYSLAVNLLGSLGGEVLPAGLSVSGLGMLSGGLSNPPQTAALSAVQNRSYAYYVLGGWSDTATLDAWSAELTTLWSDARQQYPLAFTARRASLSQAETFGAARNDKYISCAVTYGTPGPVCELAARYAAQCVRSLINHPARPLHTLTLVGERAAPESADFGPTDRKSLLWSGCATLKAGASQTVQIDRAITLYQRSDAGDADDTWLDVTTPATVARIVTEVKSLVNNMFIVTRCILVDDDTAVGVGIPYATPKKIRAAVYAHYATLASKGLVENFDAFKKLFQVGRDPDNPTRVNMIYTPDLANPLVTFAAQVKFSLQWPSDLALVA